MRPHLQNNDDHSNDNIVLVADYSIDATPVKFLTCPRCAHLSPHTHQDDNDDSDDEDDGDNADDNDY